ncbi:hypothetical protein TREMEDRAFT_55906, partial [Tremella mesenterica DSM 1558]|uniref:uncharacterized protein n=1 Tax=Tremella mesenterica (strain ATCC 24925 / CBS 8224 / DSM 1558 / NBRC 9311 / NRRL Y-6157 / RJB 2259-6 / UBC 559-6) TaxID=578456 RepID=UPI0003F48CC8
MAERRNDWNDFQWFIQTYLPRQRVAELRQFVAKIEQATRVSLNLRSQERKADLLTKIENAFRVMKQNNDLSTYSRVRYECEMLGQPRPTQAYTAPQPAPRFGGVPVPSHKTSNVSSPGIPSTSYVAPYPSSSSSSWPRPESSANNLYNRGQAVLQDWKASPMWKPIKALTNMEPLPDIAATENSHIRREKRAHFTLTPEIIQKLDFSRSHPSSHPHASIRIFCTSSDYYRPLGTPL